MTNKIKTIQNPRMILVACKSPQKIAELISEVLDSCSYNTCIDDYFVNTDYIIASGAEKDGYPDYVIADTVVFDGNIKLSEKEIAGFRKMVCPYESVVDTAVDDSGNVLTYSAENYSADITCRNIENKGSSTVFEIIISGILSRIKIDTSKYSVDEVLICTAVLTATGIPLASVIGYFNEAN